MCGIVGYVGAKSASNILLNGLKRLEYRGYDSAGMAIVEDGQVSFRRAKGRVTELEKILTGQPLESTIGIAHTRWATHGKPSEKNAHPHVDASGRLAIVHNGIIENHRSIRSLLESKGITFQSDTDTESLIQLIGYFYSESGDLIASIQRALKDVQGTYGIALICADQPGKIIAARRGSPLIVGVGDGEFVIASDGSAIVEHTSQVIFLKDNEMVEITEGGYEVTTMDAEPIRAQVDTLELSLEEIELGSHEHYMHKEIFEQPQSLTNCLAGRLDLQEAEVVLGGLSLVQREMANFKRVLIFACGTAWHAGLVGEYLFEELSFTPSEVEYASELRYRNPIIEEGTLGIVLSQSGETADSLAALREIKRKGATAFGVVNVVGSSIARETDAGVYLHVGPEIGVASTKAFTAQVAVLTMMAIDMGRRRYLSHARTDELLKELHQIPGKVEKALALEEQVREITAKYVDRNNWLYLGRGVNYPVALEGALKLKEISYIHAEGMPAAEMKHGPIALIDEDMPVVVVAPQDHTYDKVLSNIEEVHSRHGRIIAIATEGDTRLSELAEEVIYVPKTSPLLSPLVTTVPLQLMAYHAALMRDHNVDKPRNLAKSVTVE
ncbi:MAG: glutamine--fructose-6-phosphate transaminase (isomerizing) [Planctomycetota bacterium]|nr:glutamine--fructose-6-phosphate transaminase (isomerizing) [Planctomycetota bacterium]MDP6504118.1 glutamine--fructose-6-phosphate transaminase (isomerizing) [Planctomycetota bacterium]